MKINAYLPSITIGIPAYNEANNIKNLLFSITEQKQDAYRLEKIVIISDGSTDETVNIVSGLKKNIPEIELVIHRNRLGKCTRLNEIHLLNKSDYLVIFDADLVLGQKDLIENMIKPFNKEKIGITAANSKPISTDNISHRIILAWYNLWYEVRKDYNGGDTIHNLHGCATAIRKNIARKISYPHDITGDQDFLYLSVREMKYRMSFCIDAVVSIRFPNNFKEFAQLMTRTSNERSLMIKKFGAEVDKVYQIPLKYKFEKIIFSVARDPLFTLLSFLYYVRVKSFYHKSNDALTSRGLWVINKSTKKPIPMVAIG